MSYIVGHYPQATRTHLLIQDYRHCVYNEPNKATWRLNMHVLFSCWVIYLCIRSSCLLWDVLFGRGQKRSCSRRLRRKATPPERPCLSHSCLLWRMSLLAGLPQAVLLAAAAAAAWECLSPGLS